MTGKVVGVRRPRHSYRCGTGDGGENGVGATRGTSASAPAGSRTGERVPAGDALGSVDRDPPGDQRGRLGRWGPSRPPPPHVQPFRHLVLRRSGFEVGEDREDATVVVVGEARHSRAKMPAACLATAFSVPDARAWSARSSRAQGLAGLGDPEGPASMQALHYGRGSEERRPATAITVAARGRHASTATPAAPISPAQTSAATDGGL